MVNKKNSALLIRLQIIATTLIQFAFFGRRFIYYPEIKSFLLGSIIASIIVIAIITFRRQKLTPKITILYALSIMIGAISYIITKDTTLLYIALIAIIAIGNNLESVAKIDLISKIITLVIIVSLFVTGKTLEVDITRNGILRQSLGFHHPNALGYILTMIYADTLILLDSKKKSLAKLLIGAVFMAIIFAANSRTSAIIIIALSLFELLKNKLNFSRKQEKILACFVPLILLSFSFIATNLYISHSGLAFNLNQAFTGRIALQAHYDTNYTIPILGQDITSTLSEYTLDNGYYHILYEFGVIGEFIILLLYISSIKRAVQDGENKIMPHILLLLSIYALMETNPVRIMITPLTLYSLTKNEPQEIHSKNRAAEKRKATSI